MNQHDLNAITVNWTETNRRREELIERKISGSIMQEEMSELSQLQKLADLRVRLIVSIGRLTAESGQRILDVEAESGL